MLYQKLFQHNLVRNEFYAKNNGNKFFSKSLHISLEVSK